MITGLYELFQVQRRMATGRFPSLLRSEKIIILRERHLLETLDWFHIGQSRQSAERKICFFDNKYVWLCEIISNYLQFIEIVCISVPKVMTVITLTTLWLDPGSIERLTVAYLNPVIHLICIKDLHWALPHNGSTVPGLREYQFYFHFQVLE